MASQTNSKDAEGSNQEELILPHELRLRDLLSKRLLGKGLAGVGYETEWNGKRCARKDFVGVPSYIFRKEIEELAGLEDHKNIVKTYGWTIDKRSCSIILEFMDDDLLGFLRKRKEREYGRSQLADTGSVSQYESNPSQPFKLPEALHLIEEVAEGMKQLHDKGIAHGDLKTRNVLVNYLNNMGDDRDFLSAKVADFGLVRTKRKSMFFVSREARKLDIVQWKAPELIYLRKILEDEDETSSESDSDLEENTSTHSVPLLGIDALFAADVYSFAVTCSQILTGEDPYPNLKPKELALQILNSNLRPKLLDDCPCWLGNLLKSCWDMEPRYRPTFSDIQQKLQLNRIQDVDEMFIDTSRREDVQVDKMLTGVAEGHLGAELHLGNRRSKGGIFFSRHSKGYTVNIRPRRWLQSLWIGGIESYKDAQFIADAVYHYTGTPPFHFPAVNFKFPPLECMGTSEPLTSREMCSEYVLSIAKGDEFKNHRVDFLRRVKELVLGQVKDIEKRILQQVEDPHSPTDSNNRLAEDHDFDILFPKTPADHILDWVEE